jgi:hypothetical protein
MRRKFLASLGLLAVVWLAACGRQAPPSPAKTTDAATTGTPPRTAWGDPDLQGVWENLQRAPLERPKEFGTREFMTEQEAAERAKRAPTTTSGTPTLDLPAGEAEEVVENLPATDVARNAAADAVPEDTPGRRIVGAEYNAFWNAPVKSAKQSLRTSQIMDPPDGRLPSYTREVLAMWDAREKARTGRGQGDSWEDRGLGERCIAQPVGNGVFLGGYKNIMQAPGYVVIQWFTPGDGVFRIVPLDGRPPVGERIRQWYGDGRGRWEGDTLVVETTNFNNGHAGETLPAHGNLFGTGHSHNYAGTGETLRLVERFTRINADTMEYRSTIEDPKVFVRPWTAVAVWNRDDGKAPEYEYACHEHNYGMVNLLSGARANERESLAEAARELNIRRPGIQQKREQLKQWEASQEKGSSR